MTKARDFRLGYTYHITGRGNKKNKIFIKTSDYKYFIRLINKYTKTFNIPVLVYCLLPNHYHLLLMCVSAVGISQMMHRVNTAYTVYMRKKYDWTGHVFQDRYFSKEICDAAYFKRVLEYIQQNPIEAGLSEDFEKYHWGFVNKSLVKKVSLIYSLIPGLEHSPNPGVT